MAELEIEQALGVASIKLTMPLLAKYTVLKDRLFKIEYGRVGFPGGNDHGPGHIQRVLEKLDRLLGTQPLERRVVTEYELFLTMMSILYHDIGMLRRRRRHADISGLLVLEEQNEYIVDKLDKDIINAAVVSHSHTKNIEKVCSRFSESQPIGAHTVRPRVIAALVRLADELDEDYRRADPVLQRRLKIRKDSQFYWEFCRRIQGIEPRQGTHEIFVSVEFAQRDIARSVLFNGESRSFLGAFAEKLGKMNRERVLVNKFLPEELRYDRMTISVRPLEDTQGWTRPRSFVFGNDTTAPDFVARFPELLKHAATESLQETLEYIRIGELDKAHEVLQQLEKISIDLPANIGLAIPYEGACVASLRAESYGARSQQRITSLNRSQRHFREWLKLGLGGAWKANGQAPKNEIFRMGSDPDLICLLKERRQQIVRALPKNLRSALPEETPRRPSGGSGGGGGCVPIGTAVETAFGAKVVEDLRPGAQVLVFHPGRPRLPSPEGVSEVHTTRAPECIRLNRRYLFTPEQPLYTGAATWIPAGRVSVGMHLVGSKGGLKLVRHVESVAGYFTVYDLTTAHPSHTYVANGFICHNKLKIV